MYRWIGMIACMLVLSGCGTEGSTGSGIVINEVAPAGKPFDWFELYNKGEKEVDLSKWSFTDDLTNKKNKANFPEKTVIKPGEYKIFYLGNDWPGFGLGKKGEELGLMDPEGKTVDSVKWPKGAAPETKSFGRFPDLTGEFKTLQTQSPGKANTDK